MLNPLNEVALRGKYKAVLQLNKPKESLLCVDRLLTMYPAHKEFLENKYRLHTELGEYAPAIACIDKLLGISPNNEELLRDKIRYLEKLGRDDDASITQEILRRIGIGKLEDYLREVLPLGPPTKEQVKHALEIRKKYKISRSLNRDIYLKISSLKTVASQKAEAQELPAKEVSERIKKKTKAMKVKQPAVAIERKVKIKEIVPMMTQTAEEKDAEKEDE
jgi:tetratricopeptide (TPR) repeat protein